jgi:phosphoribosyl 1,2-cyclic phosphodiesterase
MNEFRIKFWGVRGSHPVPGNDTIEIGGNTSCVEIRVNGHLIILDAGTGIIKLGNQLVKDLVATGTPITATILFSHMHHDHNQGFPFFKPAYIGSSTLYFFGPQLFQEDIGEVLRRAMLPPFFPVELSDLSSARTIQSIRHDDIIILKSDQHPHIFNKFRDKFETGPEDVVIHILKGYAHPNGGILFYKIQFGGKSLVYASDTEGYAWGDQKLIEFSRKTDILIHDAQYSSKEYSDKTSSKQGFGHSTPEMAIDVAQKAEVGKLVLYHHDPDHPDVQVRNIEKGVQKQYANSVAAYEGMELNLIG